MSNTKNRKIMDEVGEVMRLPHCSIHMERSYCDWIKRFILFYHMKSRDDPENGEIKIKQFPCSVDISESNRTNRTVMKTARRAYANISRT
ncbi:MAG: hypothetical protein AB7S75_09105 [Desulfococcaceae bacterium]